MLLADGAFAHLLDGIAYRIESISPWSDATGGSQLGTVVDIRLDAPLTATTRLPGVRFNPDGTTYRNLSIPANVTGATTMTLLVDLRSRRLVSAMPPDATLSPTPDTHGLYAAPNDAHGS